MVKNILLTGKPAVGKTTIIKNVLTNLPLMAGGFYTWEIKRRNRRVGFEIITLEGTRKVMSSVGIESRFKVGKYGVDLQALEELGVREILDAIKKKDLIVIDEIGKMELLSRKFREAVWKSLEIKKPVLGTITQGKSPFVSKVKNREDVELIEVRENNRNLLVGSVIRKFEYL
jgi:nucleoside-triphosphatase